MFTTAAPSVFVSRTMQNGGFTDSPASPARAAWIFATQRPRNLPIRFEGRVKAHISVGNSACGIATARSDVR
jgi:hypothetical protein